MQIFNYSTTDIHNQSRIDVVLSKLSERSRSFISNHIKNGKVRINGIEVRDPSYIVKEISLIEILIDKEIISEEIIPKKIDFKIIYEDEHMLVIDKPAGLTVHPGAGNFSDTLVNALKYEYQNSLSSISGDQRAGIVHRLDKDTSGLMLVAKSNDAHIKLSEQIKNKIVQRRYLALIFGVPKPFSGIIDNQIGRSNSDRKKMTILSSGGKRAITEYNVKKILCSGLFSLIECRLFTGRTHQIRVHLSHKKHSIIGDQLYGSNLKKIKKFKNEDLFKIVSNFNRQALHSYFISFHHPISEEYMEFEIPIADDIKNLYESIEAINA